VIKRSIESYEEGIAKLAAEVKDYSPIFVCGTGSNLGVALEAAVKIQETNNVVTRGEDTGNLLHGPVVSVGESWMLMTMITGYDLALSQDLFKLANGFGARCVAIAEPGMNLGELANDTFFVAEAVDPSLAALIYLPSIQLLTYYIAIAKGLNPDVTSGMEACLNLILPPGREEPDSTIK
jgi:glucosamine--fructose-6-phosphate aminotransferase (isomerizing)